MSRVASCTTAGMFSIGNTKPDRNTIGIMKKNDEVMTSGGIIGKVKDIKEVESEGGKETRVTVESGTATVVVERSRIVRIGGVTRWVPAALQTPRIASRPTVSPGWSATRLQASITPGMKLARS